MPSRTLYGIPVSAGVAIGKAYCLNRNHFSGMARQTLGEEDVPREMERLGLEQLIIRVGYINRCATEIRTAPDPAAQRQTSALFGQIYEILREKDDWYEVIIGKGITGWVHRERLSAKEDVYARLDMLTRGASATIDNVAQLAPGKKGAMVRSGHPCAYELHLM